jgi:hypothetical protein
MKGPIRNALRQLTPVMRPLALRSAGKEGSASSVIHHVGAGRAGEATMYFRPKEQRLHRQFDVGSALRLRRE